MLPLSNPVTSFNNPPQSESPKRPLRLAHVLPYTPFETVLEATDNLAEDHLLSELSLTGRLYSGVHPDGTLIAVREVEATDIFEAVITKVASLRHPGIALLMGFSAGASEAHKAKRYLVYEFLQGGNLRDRMQQFPCDSKIQILVAVATALNFAASRDVPVYHGGISDSNIVFDHSGNPKLTDFHLCALQGFFAPSLERDLNDFADVIGNCVSDDWPRGPRLAALRLVDEIKNHGVPDFRSLLDALGKISSAREENFPPPPAMVRNSSKVDEAIQTEPLLPSRDDSAAKAGCCVVA